MTDQDLRPPKPTTEADQALSLRTTLFLALAPFWLLGPVAFVVGWIKGVMLIEDVIIAFTMAMFVLITAHFTTKNDMQQKKEVTR